MTATYPWIRATAALTGIAAILGTLAAIPNMLAHSSVKPDSFESPDAAQSRESALQDQVIDQIAVNSVSIMSRTDPWLPAVPLGDPVTMVGDPGFGARIRADHVTGLDDAAFAVHIENAGTEPLDASFSEGCAWLEMDDGERYYPPGVSSLTSDWFPSFTVDPATESGILLIFKIPPHVRPASLILCLRLGEIHPTAEWTLTP